MSYLDKLKRKRNKIKRELVPVRTRLIELKENEVVNEYIGVEKNDSELYSKLCGINEKILVEEQLLCQHNIWYTLSSSNDDHEGKVYRRCKCLDCEKIAERRSKEFGRIISEMNISETIKRSKVFSYETVKKEYVRIRKQNKDMDIDAIFKILKEKVKD